MTAKHTPGPWTNQVVRTSVGVCFKIGPFPWRRGKLNHACIYADYPTPSNPEYLECAANARLIAAAPEMLEALRVAKEFMEIASDWNIDEAEIGGEMRSTYDWLDVIRSAIAKATGEQA